MTDHHSVSSLIAIPAFLLLWFLSDHQGLLGYRDDEVATNINAFLTANPAEFILLHIGTNSFDTLSADVENILDNIDTYEATFSKQITVILAKIIDTVDKSLDISTFNTNVVNMVNARTDDVVIVDQFAGAGITYTLGVDMADNLHPTNSGYTKMAVPWLNALTPLLPKCP